MFDLVGGQVEHLDVLGLFKDLGSQSLELVSSQSKAIEGIEATQGRRMDLTDQVVSQVQCLEAMTEWPQSRVRDVD